MSFIAIALTPILADSRAYALPSLSTLCSLRAVAPRFCCSIPLYQCLSPRRCGFYLGWATFMSCLINGTCYSFPLSNNILCSYLSSNCFIIPRRFSFRFYLFVFTNITILYTARINQQHLTATRERKRRLNSGWLAARRTSRLCNSISRLSTATINQKAVELCVTTSNPSWLAGGGLAEQIHDGNFFLPANGFFIVGCVLFPSSLR